MSLFYREKNNQNFQQNKKNEFNPQTILPSNPYGQDSIVEKQNKENFQKKSQIKKDQQPQKDPTFPTDKKGSVFLSKNQDEEKGWFSKLCACTRLQYYKNFFKVTNFDVMNRILQVLKFWEGKFFENKQQQQYDFYGPFWIYTTVVFCLSAVPNILKYQVQDPFNYDFQIIGIAFATIYLWGFVFPALLTLLMKIIGIDCTYIQIICLYGYSMSTYIICLILCSFNVSILHWILLLYACGNKAAFIIKNIFQGMEIPTNRKIILTVIILLEVFVQFFIFKFKFIKNVSAPNLVTTSTHHKSQTHLHFRHHHYSD